MKATWGHWCYEQEPTTLPTSMPRCPQCGAINWSAIKSSPASEGPGETVPGAGEHVDHPGAPSPAPGGSTSGGAA